MTSDQRGAWRRGASRRWRPASAGPAAAAAVILVAVAGVARAAVSVPPFGGAEELAMFAPEVSRVVAAELDRSGVDVTQSGGLVVSGRIESLDRDRVRLRPHPVHSERRHTVAKG